MEQPETQTPVAEAPVEAAAPAPASTDQFLTASERLARVFGHLPDDTTGSASNGTGTAPPKPDAEDDDEESSEESESNTSPAPTPGAETKPLSRRQQAAAADKARIAELEAAVESERQARETAVEQARAEAVERHEQQQRDAEAARAATAFDADYLGNEAQFQQSLRLLDNDPRLYEAAPNGDGTLWDWRELRKERRLQHPHVERHYQTVAEQQIAAVHADVETTLKTEREGFWDGVKREMAVAATLPHTNPKDLARDNPDAPKTFLDTATYYHAAGAAWKTAEFEPQLAKANERIAELEDQIHDLKFTGPRGLGSERAPVSGGRSAGADANPSRFDPNRSARENLAAALGFD